MNALTPTDHGELQVTADRCLRYSIFDPSDSAVATATVIFIPGFKGFKDWGGWPWFCGSISAKGFRVVAINPTMCGVGPALTEFDEPEKFALQTLSHDLEDVSALLKSENLVTGQPWVVIGHSRGGIVAALAAALHKEICAVVTLGTPHDLMRLTPGEVEEWRNRGYREIVNARTGEVLQQDAAVLEDYDLHSSRYDPAMALASTDIPVLGIHGTDDPAVPPASLERLFDEDRHPLSQKVLIKGAGHTFGMIHPHQGAHEHAEEVLGIITNWLGEVV